jgi:CubicO group peptidase (beta-lactamase class C family)
MSSSAHSAIDGVLEQAVESGAVPNVVAIAADREGVLYEGAAGRRAPDDSEPVGPDTRFRIMSMTKMVATVAALRLMEQAKLDINAPVEEYCPDFAGVQVLERVEGGKPILRPPASRVTVKQLITHTSGLGYWFWSPGVRAWEQATDTPNVLSGSRVVFNAPMVADPGTQFVYGINTDWLGRVVEAAGGRGLDEAIATGITEPLGMADTSFRITEQQLSEATPIHLKGEDGRWAASDCCSTCTMSRAAGAPAPGPGRGWPTRATGSTARPASRARSTRSSSPSSRPRPCSCTPTSRPRCTRRCNSLLESPRARTGARWSGTLVSRALVRPDRVARPPVGKAGHPARRGAVGPARRRRAA